MSYNLAAFIGKIQTLEQALANYEFARVVELAQGFALLPITAEFYDELSAENDQTDPKRFEQFRKLSFELTELARRISNTSAIAYVEADFFGGVGFQTSIVWKNGSIIIGPLRTNGVGAINQALKILGVQVENNSDEFEAIGLERYRDTEDWIEFTDN